MEQMEVYKSHYDNVIKTMNENFHPLCGPSCLFKSIIIGGDIFTPPRLIRACNLDCSKCNRMSVSFPNFAVCHKCATETEYPKEFWYYHEMCRLRAL